MRCLGLAPFLLVTAVVAAPAMAAEVPLPALTPKGTFRVITQDGRDLDQQVHR